ncbi:MAG: hypothetical protein LBT95_05465 [Treponema sp.]|jgi:hypothetical protein|nr:hypothetical protein [Treponema sp.]
MKDQQTAWFPGNVRGINGAGNKLIRTMLLFTALVFFSCASKEGALEEAPIITSATYQHTQYNGRNQAVEVSAAKDDVPPFIITYFASEEDLEHNRNGGIEPPREVGDYYVRIERPGGNGYRQGKNIKIEYHIQKAFISLAADPVQYFSYDGKPKEAAVYAEPPVDIRVNYFTAPDSAGNTEALVSPPVERGRYRALLVFQGNGRYMGASKEIELLIQ